MNKLNRAAIVGLLALATGGFSAPATAAPDNGNTFQLDVDCSNGEQYTITLLQTTPEQVAVHAIGSTAVFVPTTFQFHTRVTDTAGNVLDESTTPPQAVHGASGAHLDTIECTFSQFAHHVWPEVGPVTIEVDGTVEARVAH